MDRFWVVSGAYAASTFILVLLYLKISVRYHKLLKHQATARAALNNINTAWCYWRKDDKIITCSNSFYNIFGVEKGRPILQKEVLHILAQDYALSHLRRALEDLKKHGVEFCMNINFQGLNLDGNNPLGQDVFLEVTGRISRIMDEESRPVKPQPVITLSFKNITETMAELGGVRAERDYYKENFNTFSNILDSLPLPFWCRDSRNNIFYCNDEFSSIVNFSKETIVDKNIGFIDDAQPVNSLDIFKKAIFTKKPQKAKVHKVVNGERRLLEVNEIPVKNHSMDPNIVAGYAVDITKLESAENDLNQSIMSQREVLQYISVPIAIFDQNTCLTFFNRAYSKLFDFEENWLNAMPNYGEILENMRERRKLPEYSNFLDYKRKSIGMFNNLLQPTFEVLQLSDGKTLRTVVAPHPLGGLIFVFDDMTDKLSLERGYKTLVAVQKETIEHLYEGLIVFGSDNRVKLSNPSMERIWGLPREALAPGSHVSNIFSLISDSFLDNDEKSVWRDHIIKQAAERNTEQGQLLLQDQRRVNYTYVPLPDGAHLLTFVNVETASPPIAA